MSEPSSLETNRTRSTAIGRWLMAALPGLVLLTQFPAWLPDVPSSNLDPGWILALGVAGAQRLQFGTDILFTWGPLGVLTIAQYNPALYGVSVLCIAALTALCWWLVIEATTRPMHRGLAFVGLLILGLAGWESILLALPLMYVHHAACLRRVSAASMLSVVGLAAIALTKFTMLPVTLAAVMAAAVLGNQTTVRLRFLKVGLFCVAVPLLWTLAAGQRLEGFPHWLLGALEISRGYPAAMATAPDWVWFGNPANRPALILALCIVMCAAATVWAFVRAPSRDWRRLVWPAFTVLILMLASRQGIIRGDLEHIVPMLLLVSAIGVFVIPTLPRRDWASLFVICSVVLVGLFAAFDSRGKLGHHMSSNWEAFASAGEARWRPPVETLDRRMMAWTDSVRQTAPVLPTGGGTFDILGFDQYLLAALPVEQWRPRPIFQSYSVYTPGLAGRNAQSIAAADGPDWLIVRPSTIDGRWPSQDDAALWPLLKTHFNVSDRSTPTHLVLARRAEPKGDPGATTLRHEVTAADWIDVPKWPGQSIYVSIQYELSARQRLRDAVWRPTPQWMEIIGAGQTEPRRFRLVRAIASHGFLLSPEIGTTEQLKQWLDGTTSDDQHLRIRVVNEHGKSMMARYSFQTTHFLFE